MITLKPVNSKMLQSYGYDAHSNTLAVRFGPSRVYHFKDVPPEVYEEFDKSESVGIAFSRLIRGKYEHEVVLEESLETVGEGE